ncbi:hypothetical protein [Dyadobacter sp. MSC1_007]|uniref:hypothetical protein n=1 Tax=Dyadobacter sp. MSC1_007 TaxID=2909264 RepID=UPI00202E15DC|nr:hypothetical protein [Dyadobacter sp. MSC1_007]
MKEFTIGNLLAIHFVDRPGQIPLRTYRYQHKFLYINGGTGVVKLDQREFSFEKGSLYVFRAVSLAEIISSSSLAAFLIVFNTIPFPDLRVLSDRTKHLQIVEDVIKLIPVTSEIIEHKVVDLNDLESLTALLKMVQKEAVTPLGHSDEIILHSTLNIIKIAVRVEAKAIHTKGYVNPSSNISEIMDQIGTLLQKNRKITIPQIATSLNTTSCALNRVFIKDARITLSDYLRENRSKR